MIWTRKYNNFHINDIIRYKVNGEYIYSKIIRITSTTLKVINLNLQLDSQFIENSIINPVTKNTLSISDKGYTRRAIYKLE